MELGRSALPRCGGAHQLGSSLNFAIWAFLLWLRYVGFYVNVLLFFLSDSHLLLNCTVLILTKTLAEISWLSSPSILHASIFTCFTFRDAENPLYLTAVSTLNI